MLGLFSSLWGKILIIATGSAFALAGAFFLLFLMAQGEASRERAGRVLAEAANEANQNAIKLMQDHAAREAIILRRLDELQAGIAQNAQERRAQLEQLARDNPNVQDDLDYRFSLDLVCLRDAQNGVTNPDCPTEDQ